MVIRARIPSTAEAREYGGEKGSCMREPLGGRGRPGRMLQDGDRPLSPREDCHLENWGRGALCVVFGGERELEGCLLDVQLKRVDELRGSVDAGGATSRVWPRPHHDVTKFLSRARRGISSVDDPHALG